MPKLIDYPRTSYTGAWEVAEVVDDTGGKCALDTCARKLNRKVSGSFKAIIGSAVKFGLLTSKREILTTTTLFRRIKHAYDKQEELTFHREAFLTPPLFTQLCRKFRTRELPVAMLDVLLIREFEVEEINAQGVAKAFIDGARMVGVLDEHDIIADIDQLNAQQPPRRELASVPATPNNFRQSPNPVIPLSDDAEGETEETISGGGASLPPTPTTSNKPPVTTTRTGLTLPASRPAPVATTDAIASLFGLGENVPREATVPSIPNISGTPRQTPLPITATIRDPSAVGAVPSSPTTREVTNSQSPTPILFRLQLTGPGINTTLEVLDAEDLLLVRALLDKIERQLRRG